MIYNFMSLNICYVIDLLVPGSSSNGKVLLSRETKKIHIVTSVYMIKYIILLLILSNVKYIPTCLSVNTYFHFKVSLSYC